MASLNDDQIDGLEDLMTARHLMKSLSLEVKGVKTLEMAKMRLRLHQATSQPSTVKQGPDPDVVTRLVKGDATRREELLAQLNEVASFIDTLPEARRNELNTAFPQLLSEIENAKYQLCNEQCAILVAGETSSGKSSLLNLLLGETERKLLPVAHLSCSSVICELKYGEKPRGVAHPWPDDPNGEVRYLDLTRGSAEEVLSEHIYQKQERTRRFQFQRVEIFWPCEWLKTGVSIVDSPGVGESEEMTELVKEYLPKAFGFIYVINCANAGGVQPDRLQDLLFAHIAETKKYQDEGWQFDPNTVVFICNKWDLIKVSERSEVKEHIINQLQECWPGFSESQIFFLSTSEALESLKHGQINNDYGRLLSGIEHLLPIGLNQKITRYFRFTSQILEKATAILKTYVTQLEVGDLDRQFMCKNALERLREVEGRPNEIKAELNAKVESEVDQGIAAVKHFLQTPEVIERLCKWHDSDCPSTDKVDALEDLIIAYAMKRIRRHVNGWEKKEHVFEKIQKRIAAAFEAKFLSVKHELELIENSLTSGERSVYVDDPYPVPYSEKEISKPGVGTGTKVLIGVTSPIWVPVGLVIGIFALPAYGIKYALRQRKDRQKLDRYSVNKATYMTIVTKQLLGEITESTKLKELLEDKVSGIMTISSELTSRIPNLIEADKLILKNMEEEMRNMERTLSELYPLREKALRLQGCLDRLYIEKIRTYDVDIDNITDWDELSEPIAEGQFGMIFKASLIVGGELGSIPVALKRTKLPLSEMTSTEFLAEEYNLRKLQRPFIIKYHGTALKKKGGCLFPIMVMEYCENNLETIIYDKEKYSPPGSYTELHRKPYLLKATEFAHELSQGIRDIHTAGFVHRDLKPCNILVTKSGHLRLADMGLSREERHITGTVAGTPLYMAPEVVMNGHYDRKADMFAFGLIMWELWYGSCVIDVYKVSNHKHFTRHAFKEHEPDTVWKPLMESCWSADPDKRPNITNCDEELGKYLHQLHSF